jgi:hypothetical protein
MNPKTLLASMIVLTLAILVLAQQSIARPTPSTPVPCYYFQDETVKIENTCTYEGSSWTAGGSHTLKWEDASLPNSITAYVDVAANPALMIKSSLMMTFAQPATPDRPKP